MSRTTLPEASADAGAGADLLRIVRINEEIKSVVGIAFRINIMALNAIFLAKRAGTTALIRYQYDLPSTEFCEGMFAREGAFVTPGSAFGEEYAFRIGYACARATLVGGLAAISAYLRTLE